MTPLEKGRLKAKENREAGIPVVVLNPDEKSKASPNSLKAAITNMCWQCANEQKMEVKLCPITSCALYSHRPWQNYKESKKPVEIDED